MGLRLGYLHGPRCLPVTHCPALTTARRWARRAAARGRRVQSKRLTCKRTARGSAPAQGRWASFGAAGAITHGGERAVAGASVARGAAPRVCYLDQGASPRHVALPLAQFPCSLYGARVAASAATTGRAERGEVDGCDEIAAAVQHDLLADVGRRTRVREVTALGDRPRRGGWRPRARRRRRRGRRW